MIYEKRPWRPSAVGRGSGDDEKEQRIVTSVAPILVLTSRYTDDAQRLWFAAIRKGCRDGGLADAPPCRSRRGAGAWRAGRGDPCGNRPAGLAARRRHYIRPAAASCTYLRRGL